MKTHFFILLALCFATGLRAQVPVLYYDFESNSNRSIFEATPEQAIVAGTTALTRINTSSASTSGSAGAGLLYNGFTSGTAIQSNKWPTTSTDPGVLAGDYYQLTTSSAGFDNLTLKLDAFKTASQAANKIGVSWSADGLLFYPAATAAQTVTAAWNTLTFSLPALAANQTKLVIRIYAYDAGNSGSSLALDNLTLSAATINASKTLLDYSALGLSLTSGTAVDPAYNNLTIAGTGTVVTLGGNVKLVGTVNLSGGKLSIGSATLLLNGTISQSVGLIDATTGTLSFGGSSAQTIQPAWFTGAINNLTITNPGGVMAGGNLSVSGNLLLSSGVFSLGATTFSIGGSIATGSGTLSAGTATVTFNGTAAQAIAAGVFPGSLKNLTVNNAAGVSTAADVTITGTLTLANGTCNITTATLTITGDVITASGIVNATAGTVVFNGTAAQTIAPAMFTASVRNLQVNNPAGLSVAGNVSVANNLLLTAGTVALNANTLSIGGAVTRTGGTINATAGTVVFNGTAAQTILASAFSGSFNNLTVNNAAGVSTAADVTITGTLALTDGVFSAGTSTLTVKGNITRAAGTIDASAGTVVFNGGTAQTVAAGVFSGSIKNLTVNNSAGVTSAADATITGALALTAGTFNTGTSTQTISGNISVAAGTIDASAGTVVFNGSTAQTVPAAAFSGNFNNLTINNGSGLSMQANTTVTGLLTLGSGNFAIGTTVLTLSGTVSGSGGVINAAAGTVVFNGTTTQSVAATWFSGAVYNLTINNAGGAIATGNLTVTRTLALQTGSFSLGTATLTVKGSITRSGGVLNAATGTVVFNGNMAQTIDAGTFSGAISTLVMNNNAGVSTAADITVSGTLVLSGGVFNINDATLFLLGNINASVGKINAAAGTLVFSGSSVQSVTAGNLLSTINQLEIKNTAGVTATANATVTGKLLLTAGTFDIGGNTFSIKGSITKGTGVLNASMGTLVFNGSELQSIPAGAVSTQIAKLTVNNAGGLILNDNYTIGSALVLQAGSLALNDNTVTLGGIVSGAGSFKGSASSGLTIASATTAGTLNFDSTTDGTTNALGTLQVTSGSATLGGKLHIYVALNVAGGALDLAAKNLVLKSTPSQTAYVAEIKGSLSGETNVTAERYSPGWSSRRWRLLTSPLMNTTINAAWQEGNRWDGTATLPNNGYGTLITGQAQGAAATANTNGFDFWSAVAGASASIRTYTPGTSYSQAVWNSVTSTLAPGAFDQHQAYLLFIRGDRSNSTGSTAGSTILRPTGTLKKGSFTVAVPPSQSHTLLGNPYAAPLDFKAVYDANSSKIQPWFWIWQASLGTGSGGYVLVQPVAPGSSLYEAIPGNGSQSAANRLIHSGEGFFVIPQASAAATNAITLQEAHKSTGTPAVSAFREMDQAPAKLYVNLLTGPIGAPVLLDGVLSQFSGSLQGSGVGDVTKTVNNGENVSIQKGSNDLILASSAVPTIGDSVKLRLWGTTPKDYQLEIRTANLGAAGITAILLDQYLKKETHINPTDATTPYSFSINSDAGSKDPNRFLILVKATATLPLLLTGIQAEEKNDGTVAVQWQIADESGVQTYELQHSVEGSDFKKLVAVNARNASGEQVYGYVHQAPSATNFYRVKLQDVNGRINYSSVVQVQRKQMAASLAIYPNPVTGRWCHLKFVNKPQGIYTLTLFNLAGQELWKKQLPHSSANGVETLTLEKKLKPGNYQLVIDEPSGAKQALTLAAQD